MVREELLITPRELKTKIPISDLARATTLQGRKVIENILDRTDDRFLIITGPCSIDDPQAAIEYAQKLKQLSEQVKDKAVLVMRVYLEKPRTTIGWKGLLYDPERNDSYEIQKGLEVTRDLLIKINELGIPIATEFLHPEIPNYIGDLISWGAIGARTTESQPHREFVSGLTIPMGFKNSTSGDVNVAVDAVTSARHAQNYPGIDDNGRISIIRTNGNPYTHVVLRGGKNKPNYDSESVKESEELLEKAELPKNLIIDCSHANSHKKHEEQPSVFQNILNQRQNNPNIRGVMIESYLEEGKGDNYGQSKTDACISWKTTERLIKNAFS
ncbi:3-deoxy-7-phosphoheptulonate synthase [archaeon]|nr:3-deoxy-7-phosphoheptulonate synthase [archaeon]MBT4241963.1 3-deoxy-7-phosphoheptulonate synthase [archaeon]MBT4418510.1 3-deoxy-7-phosphoheptulonate synthase [archaeon]